MNFQEFLKSHEARKRYWARNFVGWPQFSSFQPNSSHKFVHVTCSVHDATCDLHST